MPKPQTIEKTALAREKSRVENFLTRAPCVSRPRDACMSLITEELLARRGISIGLIRNESLPHAAAVSPHKYR